MMDIYGWSSNIPNLGDDLNHWLWKRVLPPSFLSQEGTFIGIGSVLHSNHLSKISNPIPIHILGAGCRNEEYPFTEVPQELKIHAVRGPLSKNAMKLNVSIPDFDAAYAICLTDEYRQLLKLPKKYSCTLIPYFKSQHLVYYNMLFKQNKVNLLYSSSYGTIENALQTIAQSKYIISESLHGAILADALRVPWVRLKFYLQNPYDVETAEFKWKDWMLSFEMEQDESLKIPFRKSSWISAKRNSLLKPFRSLDYYLKFTKNLNYQLTPQTLFETKLEQLKSNIYNLQA